MQLVAYGAQDIYLTGNPQITFFKVVYRRHTNFSMEAIQQTINGTSTIAGSATTGNVTISRNGDLVHKVYVTSNDAQAVTDGSKIISEVELEIGGQKIDKHYAEWNDIWNELSTSESKSIGLKAMQCAIGTRDAGGVSLIQIPLNFWFCRNPGLALPLIALQYHEVKLKFTWGLSTDVGATVTPTMEVWCDYIYLDTDERRRFAQVSHEYLIEQLQQQTGAGDTTTKLNFNHPVKELVWVTPSVNAYGTAKLVLNGHDRFAAQEEEYFQLRQPFDYHTAVPAQNLPGIAAKTSQTARGLGDASCFVNSGNIGVAGNIQGVLLGSSGTSATDGACVIGGGSTDTAIIATLGTTASIFPPDSIRVGDTHIVEHAPVAPTGVATRVITTVSGLFKDTGSGGSDIVTDGTGPVGKGQTVTDVDTDESTTVVGTLFIVYADTVIHTEMADADVVNITILNSEARTSKMTKKINVYSFALKPEEHQPSGTCNFSRIDNAQLITVGNIATDDNIYAVNYNVLRIMSGMGGLAYSN